MKRLTGTTTFTFPLPQTKKKANRRTDVQLKVLSADKAMGHKDQKSRQGI